MTSLRSSTLLLAAFAPAPVSSEAVSRPLITRVSTPTLKKRDELLLCVDLAAGRGGGLRPPCRAQHAIAVERQQAGEEAGPRCLRRRLQRKHLHVALADAQMVAVPCNRVLHDLPVYAGIAAELASLRPLFKVEEIAEKLEGAVLIEQPQPDGAAEMAFKNRCRLSEAPPASAMCRRRSPAACARTLSPSMAPA